MRPRDLPLHLPLDFDKITTFTKVWDKSCLHLIIYPIHQQYKLSLITSFFPAISFKKIRLVGWMKNIASRLRLNAATQ